MSSVAVRKQFSLNLGYQRPVFTLYPVVTGTTVNGAVLTPGAGAWGALADIIAANAITVEFWLMQMLVGTQVFAVATVVREIYIQNTTEARIVYEARVHATAVTPNLSPYKMPIPVYCAPKSQIQGRTGAANAAETTRVSLLVATGL